MEWSWITTSGDAVLMTTVKAVGIYLAVIVFTRLTGLRSFSKMSSFDFAITVAMGSVVATTVLGPQPALLQAVVALGALYALQTALGVARQRSSAVARLVDNGPVLLMEEGRVIDEALRRAEVTRSDLVAKLREANVTRMSQVRAVVMESTGDVSVLHTESADDGVDDVLLEGVHRY